MLKESEHPQRAKMSAKTCAAWAHNDLANDLAAHLRGMSDRRVWADIPLGPLGSLRPDVYTIPCSFVRFTPLAYEVKVSVADFRRDATEGKYLGYLDYASGVVFACPKGLLKRADTPAGAGLIVRGHEGWRVVKAPTLAPCPDLPRDVWLKLLMDGERRDCERHIAMAQRSFRPLLEFRAIEKVRKHFGEVVAAAIKAHRDKETGHLDFLRWRVEGETASLKDDLASIKARRDAEMAHQQRRCSDMLRDLAKVVGMEANPDSEHINEMAERLETMITLAQRDATVAALLNIIADIRDGVARASAIDAALPATKRRVPARVN